MRAVWVDEGNDANWDLLKKHGITWVFYSLNEPDAVLRKRLLDPRARGLVAGVYAAWGWAGYVGTGAQSAEEVDRRHKQVCPDATPTWPRVQLNDETHDAPRIVQMIQRWRQLKFFFQQFSELHRILKPGGVLAATVPMWDSPWGWGHPGHTRVITKGSLLFLDKQEYQQIGTASPMTDYRLWYKADFETISIMEHEHVFGFILKAIKGNVRHSPQIAE